MADVMENAFLTGSAEGELDRELESMIAVMLADAPDRAQEARFHDLVAQRSRMMRSSLLRRRGKRMDRIAAAG